METSITRRDEVVRETEEDHGGGGGKDNELDPLILVHSDISYVLHKIDELVVKATERKTISKLGATIIESYRSELSDMISSLKLWFPRLQFDKSTAATVLCTLCPVIEEFDIEDGPKPTGKNKPKVTKAKTQP